MESEKSRRPSPALVISIVALFVALGGGAYAAKVAKNSVGAAQLKKKAVTTPKLGGLAVTKEKLADGAVTESKLAKANSTIRAWANVDDNGSLLAGDGVTVTKPATGRYCLALGFAPSSAVATFDADGSNLGNTKPILVNTNSNLCPGAPNNVRVFIANEVGADADRGFYIQIN
jgi:hypothetical protein